ncbi:Aminoglycoside phosphotransferase [Fusarium austroafricanum]|uniref:Aminoglycoside phosphotransferase n=1 Tax=Fusarium austroafricanum TaxID=2364996 RepID=A0A8H4KFQ9_9HYPO|nr:Aminoglycoside phosphotransferase [Fusarium austroafricanum]
MDQEDQDKSNRLAMQLGYVLLVDFRETLRLVKTKKNEQLLAELNTKYREATDAEYDRWCNKCDDDLPNPGALESTIPSSCSEALAMNTTHRLELEDGSSISYDEAKNRDENIVVQLGYAEHRKKLFDSLEQQQDTIRSLVRHHLDLRNDAECTVLPQKKWIKGSFNVCIPITTLSGSTRRNLMLRCCLPYKLAEAQYPGTIDEKLRCEVGTYAWMQQCCTDVRIPYLYGFGFTDHRHYSQESRRPWYLRLLRMFQRRLNALLHRDILSYYTLHPSRHHLPTAYMLLEHIGPDVGQMLSNTWPDQSNDLGRKKRLFRGIARAMLSLARVPQPRIGSFQFHDDCCIRLTNRPLTCSMMIFENDGTPRAIQNTETYSCTESFASDMISYHDNRLLSQPNIDAEDCREGMAMTTLLRALSYKYVKEGFRNGPFALQFTDLHASNIFVDEDWNVTCLLDLEWISALPMEMLAVPYWVSGGGIDEIAKERLEEFNQARQQFMRIFEEEETIAANTSITLSKVMEDTWNSKAFWFWHCLTSVNAMSWLVRDQICTQFGTSWSLKMGTMLSDFWCEGSQKIVSKKMDEFEVYEKELKDVFKSKFRSSRVQ